MRFFAIAVLPVCIFAASCTPAPPLKAPMAPPAEPVAGIPTPPLPAVTAPAAKSPSQPPRVTRREIGSIGFEGVSFDSATHRLAVVDQAGGPGSKYPDAQSAAASHHGIAAVNGGFFTPEGAPLGKLVSAGKAVGSWNRSSLGSGVFTESPAGHLALARREAVSTGSPQRELLQAGPLLVENSRTVAGLDPGKPAARIFLLWDGGSRWWIGRSSVCTLSQLGAALGQGSPAGWPIRTALNLDGGRSADLWVSSSVPGGPANFRPLWNRPVRNFLVLVPR